MELLPKVLVAGVFAAVQPNQRDIVNTDKLTRIWSELATPMGYRQFQLAPDGSGAQMLGDTGDDAAIIQLPVVQARKTINLTVERAAEDAQTILKTVSRHIGVGQFFNLGVKYVYHGIVESRDARAFVLHQLLGKTDDDLGDLRQGGSIFGGVKYVAQVNDAQFTLVVEPLRADNTFIFVDIDAQFPGPIDLDTVRERCNDVETYTQAVRSFLNHH